MGNYLGVTQAGSSQTDLLVDAFKKTQQSKVDNLTFRSSELNARKSFYSSLNSKLNNLITAVDKFGTLKSTGATSSFVKVSDIDSKFNTRKITVSDSAVMTATAKGTSVLGSNVIKVNRMASADILISDQMKLADKFAIKKGSEPFSVTINGVTKKFNVTLEESDTNESVIKKIIAQVNSDSEFDVSASIIRDTDKTGRLTFMSKETGESNNIIIDGGNLLKEFGIKKNMFDKSDDRPLQSGTKAGFKQANTTDLNSKLVVNGLDVTRSTNVVEDVLEGVTLTIKKSQATEDSAVTLTNELNPSDIETLANPLISAYNDLISYLNTNKSQQRNDPSISSLLSSLRTINSSKLTNSTDNEDPNYLTSIGYKAGSDGTVTMNDKDKLKTFLSKNNGAQKVADIFTSDNGFAVKISKAISNFKPNGATESGVIQARQKSLDSQISTNEARLKRVQSSIDAQAETLRKEYTSYLKVMLQTQGQAALISTMSTSTSGYDSLVGQSAKSSSSA